MKTRLILSIVSLYLTQGLVMPPQICATELVPNPSSAEPAPGDVEAQYQLARAYLKGEGRLKNPAKAFELMKKAADQGHAEAESGLGYLYLAGVGVGQDTSLAVVWLGKAAEKGVAKAQFNLGRTLLRGEGVTKNEKEGFQWIDKAAEQGLIEALSIKGEAFYFGSYGQQRDYEKAYRALLPVAEAGQANAQNMVGVLLQDGRGIKEDWESARTWFRKAAEQGDAKGQSNLGFLLLGNRPDQPARVEALKWLIVADQQNEITATKVLEGVLAKMPEADVAEARRQASELKFPKKAGDPGLKERLSKGEK